MRKVLIIPDVHIAAHDKDLWDLILTYAGDNEWTDVVQLGDYLDLDSINFHNIGRPGLQEGKRLEREIAAGRESLQDLVFSSRRGNPSASAHLLFGNHEDRLSRYLDAHPELVGALDLPNSLGLSDLGVQHYPYCKHRAPLRIGKLHFIHGSYEGKGAVARTLDDLNCNVILGHLHRLEVRTKPSQNGTLLGACVGFLGKRDLGNNYMKGPAGWTQGFAIAYIHDNGRFNLYPIVVSKREFYAPDGRLYSARPGRGVRTPSALSGLSTTVPAVSTTPPLYRGQTRSTDGPPHAPPPAPAGRHIPQPRRSPAGVGSRSSQNGRK